MGSDSHYAEEAPTQCVTVPGFWIDRTPVTNLQFEQFVRDTGYVTLAERVPEPRAYPDGDPERLVPGSLVFRQPKSRVDLRSPTWWEYVSGANWRHPEGPGTSIANREDHPVVHVADEDAAAYAKWTGKSLPNEVEWEFAARGGLDGATYSWGDDPAPQDLPLANIWIGEFPWENLKPNGPGTEPVGSYPANGYGLHDMIGNVWEWTSDWYRNSRATNKRQSCCSQVDPRREIESARVDTLQSSPVSKSKVLKGGSFLCAQNYCFRYRPAAKQPQRLDSCACHIGFRCVLRRSASYRSIRSTTGGIKSQRRADR